MAQLDHTSNFQRWLLTKEEELQGSILTITQKQCIQNQICDLAHRRLALTIDLDNVAKTVAEDADLGGQINALQYLLTLSNHAEEEYRELRHSGENTSGEN